MAEEQPRFLPCCFDVELGISSRKKAKLSSNYDHCIICQKPKGIIHNVTKESLSKLQRAAEAWKDEVEERLHVDLFSENFLELHRPKWHPACRNKYLLRSSYERAEKNRTIKEQEHAVFEGDEKSESGFDVCTRSMVSSYDSKSQCVICCKKYFVSKRPYSKI